MALTDSYRLGIELFNAGRFFDAHEALEDLWREARGPERNFLQGIIQIAVGLHHYSTGNPVGARSLLQRGAAKLAGYPDAYGSLRIDRLREDVAKWTRALAEGRPVPPAPRLEPAPADGRLFSPVDTPGKMLAARRAKAGVPLLDLHRQYESIRQEITTAIDRVCGSQQFVLGREVEAFEREAAEFLGVAQVVSCSSGTDALWLALTAAGVAPGDEVITTPFSFFASASAIVRTGARPVFADVDPRTLNLNPVLVMSRLKRSSPANLRVILPVHLYGQCADMDAFQSIAPEFGVAIVEDAAQAFGATWRGRHAGSLGTAAAFSFYPTKNLSAYGDAGCVTTNDAALAERLRLLRNHGTRRRYVHEELGWNCRMDAIQAAVLRVKLRHLNDWNAARRQRAATYDRLLQEAGLTASAGTPVQRIETASQAGHIYHQYVLRAVRRDPLREFLRDRNIGTEVYYPLPLHLQKPFAYLGYSEGSLAEAERAAGEVIALPMFPELTEREQQTVVEAMADFYS